MAASEVAPTPNRSLVQIADDLAQMFELHDSAETAEERTVALAEIDRVIGSELASKVDGIAWFDKRSDFEVAAIQEEISELEIRIGAINKRKRQVREIAKRALGLLNASLIKGRVHTISLRAGSESLDIHDQAQIPDQYATKALVTTIDKPAVKAALKRGENVPGARLVRGEESVCIR